MRARGYQPLNQTTFKDALFNFFKRNVAQDQAVPVADSNDISNDGIHYSISDTVKIEMKNSNQMLTTVSNAVIYPDCETLQENDIIPITMIWSCVFKSDTWQDIREVELQSRLGNGNFGSVYKYQITTSNHLKETFAVKYGEFKPGELALLKKINDLKNPNIVYHHAAFQGTQNCLVFMDCMQATLTDVLIRKEMASSQHDYDSFAEKDALWRSEFPWSVRLPIALGIAKAIECLHNNGIIYCDLKLDNVLLDQNDNPKLADFNLSETEESIKQRKEEDDQAQALDTNKKINRKRRGTPIYMSPELLFANDYNAKSTDVYSFGVLLWSLASRAKPIQDVKNYEQLEKKINVDGNREPIPGDCPNEVAELITFAWMRDPAKRPTMENIVKRMESNTAKNIESTTETESSVTKGNNRYYDRFIKN